ncbi:lymphocyte antigen 86-like isoform X3 [Ahaetulla prasina]|uniref:lymphocyte antigen 86-like isoform X3 n=1 Tax=Ahaetulla prasina TaxID=499056 RepID=UPI002649E3E8|nr:lymphocyte antigen 86-like isoform X3 [Ahaetulla prasina]
MKALKVVPVLLSLIYITVSVTIWPTHIICKNNNLEVNYKSCDPLQDVALSVDSCTYVTNKDVTIRLATVLRHAINELSVDFSLNINGQIAPLYSKKVCERNQPQFQFCGKKKGEYIYYTGPVSLNMDSIPQGEFNVTVQLFNEDHHTIICADFYINNQ